MKVGECVVVTEEPWVVGRLVRQNGDEYEVESAWWPELRRCVGAESVRPLGWLLRLGQAARVMAIASRWARADDLGCRAFCDAVGTVIRLGSEEAASE